MEPSISIKSSPFPVSRKSVSAKKALDAEIKRLQAMSVLERIQAALTMSKRFHSVLANSQNINADE